MIPPPADADDLLARCRFPAPEAGPVDLGVSGGPDSIALLWLARRAGLHGRVVHVDHGLRPTSAEDADLVAAAAESAGFEFECVQVQIGEGPDLEARARAARYAAMPPGVLTGHTMDDQAETVILNLLRGCGLDGLTGMAADTDRVSRPLLGLRRHETAGLCRRFGLPVVMDETNDDRRFRRNRVRHEVLPLLCAVAERDVVPLLARQAELLRADAQLLEGLSFYLDPQDAKALRATPPALARRALRRWLRRSSDPEMHPPSAAELERVMAVAGGSSIACELSGGRRVSRHRNRLVVESRS